MIMNAPDEEKAAQDLTNALNEIKEQDGKVRHVFFRYHSTMDFLLKQGWRVDSLGGCEYWVTKPSDFGHK